MKYDIIIIGAGAAGLMAMKDLLEGGYSVCLLEASAVAGGRIATINEPGFDKPVEAGAEFVHGNLPLTLSLLNEAKIFYVPMEGNMIAVKNESWKKNEAHDKHWKAFMQQLGKLKNDISIAQFLTQNFDDEKYASLRKAVKSFAEGFDLADIENASSMAACREWTHEDETYRIPGGYMQLIDFLLKECYDLNGKVFFNAVAAKIEYTKESVTVHTIDGRTFTAAKVIITVSAGILQTNSLQFIPAIDAHYTGAIQQLGFGSVIKILLQFNNPFWEKYSDDIGFLLSDEAIPTWWTQLPAENNLLTGWLGGPTAISMSCNTNDVVLHTAISSLAAIFHCSTEEIQSQLVHHKIIHWHNHQYIKGGYSYDTVESPAAKKILSHPAERTIFFSGEAMYNGQSQGTVEAALQSGRQTAKKIKNLLSQSSAGIHPKSNE